MPAPTSPASHRLRLVSWYILSALFLCWLAWIGWHRWWRPVLLTGLASASFLVGSLAGFIFTSYGEESNTIGKVKDWLIGALAGLTVIEFHSLKAVILVFALTQSPADFALALSVAIAFSCLGFFFMFFGRELLFNVPIAIARARRKQIENYQQAGDITLLLNAHVPSTLLVGIDDFSGVSDVDSSVTDELKSQLMSPDVDNFLNQSQEALTQGASLDWDIVSKVAYLHYYRAYFVDEDAKPAQQRLALDWVLRALILNPQHVDFTAKRADLLTLLKRYHEACSILASLAERSDCPLFVFEWLGFYLLFLPGREDEAAAASQAYLDRFPTNNEARRNLASAFAQKACRAPRTADGALDHNALDYLAAIRHLRIAIEENPEYGDVMRKEWIEHGGSFECFAHDDLYRQIVGLPPEPAAIIPVAQSAPVAASTVTPTASLRREPARE